MAKKDTTQFKWKKKKWRELLAPPTFANQPIGETFTTTTDEVIGKTASINLMHLTKNPRKQNITVTFKVTDVQENKGVTKTYSYVMLPASIKRFVRAGRDRIDESFILKTKDEQYIRVKPLIISSNCQSAAQRTKIRRETVAFIRKYGASIEFEAFVKDVVDGKVQKELKQTLDKITRLRTVEIRAIELIENFSSVKKRKFEKSNLVVQTEETQPEETQKTEE